MSFLRPKRVLPVVTRCVMRIVSLLSMWVRLIVDNFRVYDEMNNFCLHDARRCKTAAHAHMERCVPARARASVVVAG